MHNLSLTMCTLLRSSEEMINDVHIHPTGTCEESGAIKVGYETGSSYTFKEEDAGKELFFACDLGRRCEAGKCECINIKKSNMLLILFLQIRSFSYCKY